MTPLSLGSSKSETKHKGLSSRTIVIGQLAKSLGEIEFSANAATISECTTPSSPAFQTTVSYLEIMGRNGYVQRFRIVWSRTGFGRHRPILVCSSCGCGAIRLFSHYGNYACRYCHRAVYASQKYDQNGRKRLAACKLRLQVGSLPDIRDV